MIHRAPAVLACVALAFVSPLSAADEAAAAPAVSNEPATAPAPDSAPLTLAEAVRQALEKNYTIQVEQRTRAIADTGVSLAYSRFDPRLVFSYTKSRENQPSGTDEQTGEDLPPSIYDNAIYDGKLEGELPLGLSYRLSASTNNPRGAFNDPMRPDFDYWNAFSGVSGSLPLLRDFGGASTSTAIRIAKTDRTISEWEFQATLINTVTRVVYAYDELLFARANLAIARRLRENAASLHRENQERFRVGAMSDFDVLSAQARVATREEGVLLAENAERDAANLLKQLISDEKSAALLSRTIVLPDVVVPGEFQTDVQADIHVALQRRPDYQQARLALQRNDLDYRLYRNQLLPAVDVYGSYGYAGVANDYKDSRDSVKDRDHPAYSAGVSVTIPITSYAERARYRSARLARERAEIALNSLEQDIVVAVGSAADNIRTTWQRVLSTRASRELSERTLSAELKRLRAGTGNTFFVLQQQEILANDEGREARAIVAYRNAIAEYDRQLGRTLERHRLEVASGTQTAP
ncbi:MAG: TolC family protein [Opitutaceae bacterium]|nr:TolC family protein [Opitutaceae bacterium]